MLDADARTFRAAGLYDPDAPGAADRLALLRWLTEQGFSDDELVDAATRGRLSGLAADRVLRPGPFFDLAELSARSGVSPERIEVIRRASGLPPSEPGELVYTAADVELFRLFDAGTRIFGDQATLHFSRVMGNSLARIAETAVSMFLTDVEAPLVAQGGGEAAVARANLEATSLLDAIPGAMDTLFRVHVTEAIRRLQLARGGTGSYEAGYLAIGFVDLVGFTPLTQQLDWAELGVLVEEFEGRANDLVASRGGRLVKLIGDEVMFVTLDAPSACDVALELFATLRDQGGADVTRRGGLAVGDVLIRGGDYYGRVVNLASRIADVAVPDEILVTGEIAEEAATHEQLCFEPAGRRMLKGFDEPVELWSVTRPRRTP